VLVIDKLLVKGIRFVLDKVIQAADQELNDASALREQLLQAQMRRELGEISEEELARVEAEIVDRLREISERQGGGVIEMGARPEGEEELKVTGVEATFGGDSEGLQALEPKDESSEE
jgi:multidrug efflux pump subunit AcrA (membrane-fusion protein)